MPKPPDFARRTETIHKKDVKIFEVKDTIERSLGNGTGMFRLVQVMGGKVSVVGDKTSCECQYHKKHSGAKCKHIATVEMQLLSERNELVNEKQQQ